jgi:hypothetical protein
MAGYGASAGAALGNAALPGVGGAVGGLLGSFLDGSSAASPTAPLTATAAVYGSGLDSSGWNVNFSGSQSNGSNKAGNPSLTETLGVGQGGINTTYLLIGALLVGVIVWKKSRSK